MFSVIAQWEREIIVERTMAAFDLYAQPGPPVWTQSTLWLGERP